jgi:hypothetical protein
VIYDVVWLSRAIDELHDFWRRADATSRSAIERAVPRANDRLAIDPYSQGESRGERDIRILFELPITVRYRIERFQGSVVVLRAQLVGKRPRQ